MITKDRKSTKKNPGGPIIYGAKSPWGKPKVGHSIPQHLKNNLDHQFGLSSYHKGHASELKELLSNEIFREQLMHKVSTQLANRAIAENQPKRKVENRASELRKEIGQAKRLKNDSSWNSLPMKDGASTFSQRSKSVLPPILSSKNKDQKNMQALKMSPMHGRKGSLDQRLGNSARGNQSEQRSVYKLDQGRDDEQSAFSGFQPSKIRRNAGNSATKNVTPSKKGPANVHDIFEQLGNNEQNLILDKIHDMRMRAYDNRGYENLAKPHMPSFNKEERGKIIEQYDLAKRQITGTNPPSVSAAGEKWI